MVLLVCPCGAVILMMILSSPFWTEIAIPMFMHVVTETSAMPIH